MDFSEKGKIETFILPKPKLCRKSASCFTGIDISKIKDLEQLEKILLEKEKKDMRFLRLLKKI